MLFNHPFRLALVALLTLSLTSCDLVGDTETEETSVSTAGVYVANQGNFGDGNGSISVYDPETEQAQRDAITDLGSIVQGIAVQDTSLHVLANSAGRVDVFSTESLSQIGQITDFTGPRYLAFSDPNTAYVTDQAFSGSSTVRVLDVSGPQPQLSETIPVEGTPEGITTTGERLYAALGAFGDTTLVASIDPGQNTVSQNIDIDCPARYVVADQDADVFAFCSNAAEAVVLDGSTGDIQNRLTLPDTTQTTFNIGQPAALAPAASELYVATNSDVIRIDTEANAVDGTVDVGNAASIGAVAYDGLRDELYVARVAGFTERGSVSVYDRDGTLLRSFEAGIAPAYIDFRRVSE